MTEGSQARSISSASDLLALGVELAGVQFFRLEASVNDDVPTGQVPSEVAPVYGLKLRQEGREIGIRMSVTLELGLAKIIVDAAVNYVTATDAVIKENALLDFANEVGVMALIPYLRQAIADLSQRVIGEVVLMPVIPRHGLVFTEGDQTPPSD